LKNISDGVFIAVFSHQQEFFIFNDPMGLSNHYYHINNGSLHLTPALWAFEKSSLTLKKNPLMTGILNKIGHLFGVNTVYNEVFRMQPGSILDLQGNSTFYFNIAEVKPIAVEKLPLLIAKLIAYFPTEKRQLPISGGLDSRLMLSAGQFTLGYCYGPEKSGDRPIARFFSDEFSQFEEFDFSLVAKRGSEASVYRELLETPAQFVQDDFLAAYRHASRFKKEANVIFDGFLGDALQRGVWMYIGGVLGELYRFFPLLYTLKRVDAQFILKRRYHKLTAEEFAVFFDDFCLRTDHLALDDYAKVTYYEFIWSRGARFVNNGALTLNGQFAMIVPLFANPVVFSTLIKQNFAQTIRFKTVNKIWQLVD
jgi:hypothetical protein